jgi:hypothetical protein
MIESYINGFSPEYYINNFVNNLDLTTSEELDKKAEDSLNELYKRYVDNKRKYNGNNIHIISTYEYIKQNYKEKLLFYTVNHPTKYLIQYICKEIIEILQIENTMNYDIDILSSIRCILYKSVSKAVNFDITSCSASLLNITDINKITLIYYDKYKENELK